MSFLPFRRPSKTLRATIVAVSYEVQRAQADMTRMTTGMAGSGSKCPKYKTRREQNRTVLSNSRVVVLLIDHVDLRPSSEVHIVVRALQPYDDA